jgi:hypothetical protein
VRLACLVIGGLWYLLTGGLRPNRPLKERRGRWSEQ